MVLNAASAGKAGRQIDHKQTLMDHWLYENEDGTAAGEDAPPAEVGVDAEDVDGTIDAEFARLGRELEELGVKIELRADGGYDSRVTFAFLAALGIIPVIRVRINSGARAKGKNRARPKAVLEQLGRRGRCTGRELNRMTNEERRANQKEWKKDTRYGLRRMVEIIISAFKRAFGESVRAPAPRTAHRGRRQGGSLQPQFGHRGRGDPGRGKQAGAFVRGRCRMTRKSRPAQVQGWTDTGSRPRSGIAVRSPAACGPHCRGAPDPRTGIGQTCRTRVSDAGTGAKRAVPHHADIILQDAAAGNPSGQSSFELRH